MGAINNLKRVLSGIIWFGRVCGHAASKFYWDDCFSRASALAYTTLLSLVPIAAISISVFSVFGVKREQISGALETFLAQLLPSVQNDLLQDLQVKTLYYIHTLGESATALNTVSLCFLVVIGIALLNSVESALNNIWKTSSELPIVSKVINFWAVITLGPVLIALSIYWNAKFSVIAHQGPWAMYYESGVGRFIEFFIPVLVTCAALSLMFYRLPAARVRFHHALYGAFVSSFLFEIIKRTFGLYLTFSATDGTTFYTKLYASIAVFPLFLFWLYIVWVIILFGAEVSYQAGSIHLLLGLKKYRTALGDSGALIGIRLLAILGERFRSGKAAVSEGELSLQTGIEPTIVRSTLEILAEAGYVSQLDSRTHLRTLTVSPDKVTAREISEVFQSKSYRELPLSEKPDPCAPLLQRIMEAKDVSDGMEAGEVTLSMLLENSLTDVTSGKST